MEQHERLIQLRDEFRDGPYAAKWQAIVLARDWARIIGHHTVVDALDRFMEFVEKEAP